MQTQHQFQNGEAVPFDVMKNLQTYSEQLEYAIIQKQSSIDIQRANFLEIIKKYSQYLDMMNIDAESVAKYLDAANIVEEDFEEPQIKKKIRQHVIRIPKPEILKPIPTKVQERVDEFDSTPKTQEKQKRKYTKKQSGNDLQEAPKRKRRTKKEMELARQLQVTNQ